MSLLWRCLLLLSTSVPVWATLEEGTILSNWKKTLSNSDQLTNWVGLSDPCASNPWYHVLCNSAGFQRIDLGSSHLSGLLTAELGQLSMLEALTLYNNSFFGSIPPQLGNLSYLTYLDLSINYLSGSIPASFGNLGSLTYLEVANNSLYGRVYTNATWAVLYSTKQPLMWCSSWDTMPRPPTIAKFKSSTQPEGYKHYYRQFGIWCHHRLHNLCDNRQKTSDKNYGSTCNRRRASSKMAVVAVKHLSKSKQVLHVFLNEIVLITGIRHRNLVKLKGCCLREDQRILVYEYIENGDLSDALWRSKDKLSGSDPRWLDWPTRFKIILEIAQGLTYLHEDVQPPIIHRDIKAPNILLNSDLKPKIADFGLALLFPPLEDGHTHLSSIEIAGTRGYMAPEYASFGQVTAKVDVFSFGVLVLEIVSGRKNIDLDKPSGQQYLLEWVWKLQDLERFHQLVDKQLAMDRQSMKEITRVIRVGLLCLQYAAARRPKMSDVVAMLQGRIPLPDISTTHELDTCADTGANSLLIRGLTTSEPGSELGEFVECEEESSLLLNEAAGWLTRQGNRTTIETK